MEAIEFHTKMELKLTSTLEDIENLYFYMTGENNRRFTDNFKKDLRGIVRKYGVNSVVETMKELVDKHGNNGLNKLIPFVICKHNPKNKWKYILGIIKNKLNWRYVHKDESAAVQSIVSEIVDVCGDNAENCLNSVINRIKYQNFDSLDCYLSDMWAMAHDFRQVAPPPVTLAAPADCPRHAQALTGVAVPDTTKAEQAYIDDSDGTVPNVNVVNIKPIPVYIVEKPKDATLEQENCPIEGVGGFWESQKDYAQRVGLASSVLTAYRKTSEGARWSSDCTWGESKRGEHVFKKIEPSKPNSKFLYWVHSK